MPTSARSTKTAPQIKAQTLIVVQAFKRNKDGEIVPAMEAREMPDERRAIARAKELSLEHVGAIAWRRDAKPDEGEFGDPIVLFSRGELPDLDMPVRQDDLEGNDAGDVEPPPENGGGDGPGGPTWMGFQLEAARDWQAFHKAFYELYRKQPERELLAVFTALENRRIVVLPPLAAALVARELPTYPLRACARPPGNMLSLELGHSLQLDTTWFELSEAERQRRIDARKIPAEEMEAQDSYLEEFWGIAAPVVDTQTAPNDAPPSPVPQVAPTEVKSRRRVGKTVKVRSKGVAST